MIIVSITGPTQDDALAQIRASFDYAALFELRLDLIAGADVAALAHLAARPVIATCRPQWERGAFRGSEERRLEVLASAAESGASWVDLEQRLGRSAFRRFRERFPRLRLIASRHLDEGRRPRPRADYAALRKTGAAVLKLAFDAFDAADNAFAFEFLRLAAEDRQKAVGIAMGEPGEPSRILYRKFGGWATYAAPEGGPPAAPGQVPARMLSRLFRADRLTRRTRVFGVVGNPVGHSLGIYLHNPLFQRAHADAVYCRFRVGDLGAFMTGMAPAMAGMSVTIPHKRAILRYVDFPDGAVRAVGAANTLIRRRGRWHATNTDAAGALDALEEVQRVRNKTLLVLGAGGAARAIVYEALRRGARVLVANRTHEHARRLAAALGAEAVRLAEVGEVDIVANATPVGMAPNADETPIARGQVRAAVAFDAVYTPPETRFLREARETGAVIVSGMNMYMHQAAMQSRLYTGKKPDRALLRALLLHDSPVIPDRKP